VHQITLTQTIGPVQSNQPRPRTGRSRAGNHKFLGESVHPPPLKCWRQTSSEENKGELSQALLMERRRRASQPQSGDSRGSAAAGEGELLSLDRLSIVRSIQVDRLDPDGEEEFDVPGAERRLSRWGTLPSIEDGGATTAVRVRTTRWVQRHSPVNGTTSTTATAPEHSGRLVTQAPVAATINAAGRAAQAIDVAASYAASSTPHATVAAPSAARAEGGEIISAGGGTSFGNPDPMDWAAAAREADGTLFRDTSGAPIVLDEAHFESRALRAADGGSGSYNAPIGPASVSLSEAVSVAGTATPTNGSHLHHHHHHHHHHHTQPGMLAEAEMSWVTDSSIGSRYDVTGNSRSSTLTSAEDSFGPGDVSYVIFFLRFNSPPKYRIATHSRIKGVCQCPSMSRLRAPPRVRVVVVSAGLQTRESPK
jgi:hypothetical protein